MMDNYEISPSTIAIIPIEKKKVKVIEEDNNYLWRINEKTFTIIIYY